MKRVLATLAVAGATAAVAAAGIVPAAASPRQAARHVTHPSARRPADPAGHAAALMTRRQATAGKSTPVTQPAVTATQIAGGEFVAVMRCKGSAAPPPIRLTLPIAPLAAAGQGPATPVLRLLAKPKAYQTVYTCTVVVSKRAPAPPIARIRKAARRACGIAPARPISRARRRAMCTKVVTLNTGFGGAAPAVARHHPAG